jgi:hypothetical protein
MLDRLFTLLLGSASTLICPISASCNLLLLGLGVHGTSDKADIEKYKRFCEKSGKGVIIFNHPTFFDHMVIMKELNDVPRFAMSEKYMIGPIKRIAKYYNTIPITSAKGNAAAIQEAMSERPPPIVAPAAGNCHQTDSAVLDEFKTGAFLGNPTVLPIVIHYTPYEPWLITEAMKDTIIRRLWGNEIQYRMKVLDPVVANADESPADFAQRCRQIMETVLKELQAAPMPPISCGSSACLTTSFLFLGSSIITFYKGYLFESFGMFVVFITSVLYHATHDKDLRLIDMGSNIFWMTICSVRLMLTSQIQPLIFLVIAVAAYLLQANHALWVHIPIALGFLSIQ